MAEAVTSDGPRRRPLGVDTSLILEGSRKRRRAEGSPEADTKSALHLRGSKVGIDNQIPATDPAGLEEVRKKGLYLYEKLSSLRDVDGRFTHLEFLELPSKEDYPDYYEQIRKPISYNDIKRKIEKLEYTTIGQVAEDFKQCYVNAKRYNAPGSPIFLDAKYLHKLLKDSYSVLTNGNFELPDEDEEIPVPEPVVGRATSSSSSRRAFSPLVVGQSVPGATPIGTKRGPTLKPWLMRKFSELVALKDANGRAYADGFQSLPDRKTWEEYYRVITHPMALENISAKIAKRGYTSVKQFLDEVTVCFANAMYFNEETSRIWKDAKILMNHFTEIMKEVPPPFVPPRKYNTAKRRAEAEALAAGLPTSGVKPGRPHTDSSHQSVAPESPMYDDESGAEDEYEASHASPAVFEASHPSPAVMEPQPSPVLAVPSPTIPFDLTSSVTDPFALPVRSRSGTPVHHSPDIPIPSLPPLSVPLSSSLPPELLPSSAIVSGPASPAFDSPSPAALPSPPVNGNSTPLERSPSTEPPKPRLVSKMPGQGDLPVITRFLVRTTPPTVPITLDNTVVRQHSFAVPQATERVDFSPFFRRAGPPVTQDKGKGKAASQEPEPLLPYTAPQVKLSARPSSASFESLAELPSPDGPTHRYSLVPRPGLTVVEILVTPRGTPGGDAPQTELYRIFLTK